MLTLAKLKAMPQGMVIDSGKGSLPELDIAICRFIAKRGLVADWAVYFTCDKDCDIEDRGEKLYIESAIRRFVPCTDEVFERYRW